MKLSLRLQQLAAPDLEELLKRRPDCAASLLANEVGWEPLASALVVPGSLAAAVNALNLFLRQVLELAVFHGGRLSAATAAEEGLEAGFFDTACWELTRWGLTFPGEGGEIELIPGVSHLIWDPGSLGLSGEFMLEAQTVDVLRPMAMNMGLSGAALPTRKAEVVRAILQRMADPACVASLLSSAPELARSSFDRIRNGDGSPDSGWRPGYMEADMWRWHPDRAKDGPWWLVGHGLALPRGQGSWQLVVPAEVELALRGRLFTGWEPREPAIPTSPLPEGKHPLELVAALSSMLQEFRAAPAPALQQGGLPKRVLKRLAASLRQEEDLIQELAVLALDTGLLAEVEVVPEQLSRSRRNPRVIQSRKAEIRVSEIGESWDTLSEPERWVDFGRRLLVGAGLTAPAREHLAEFRMLGFLLTLPSGQGGRAEDLARGLHWNYPAIFPNVAFARRQMLAMGSALAWLGAGCAEPAIGLNGAGRLLAGPTEPEQGELERAFPASVDACTVTGDRRIVVSGPPSADLSQFLGRIADVESVLPARIYSLSEASLRRGLDGGLSHQEISDFLSRHCPGGIPQNVAAMIDDVAARHGRLRVGSAAVYVRSDDPTEIEALVKGRALRPLLVRRVAPTVAVVEAKGVDQVLGMLRKSGLMPVADSARGDAEPVLAEPPAMRMRSVQEPGARSEVKKSGHPPVPAQLVQMLSLAPAVDARQARDHHQASAAAVVRSALSSRRRITLGYKAPAGRAVRVLRIVPLSEAEGILQGYEYGLQQILKLDMQRVAWADPSDDARLVEGLNRVWSEGSWDFDQDDGDPDLDSEDDWDLDSEFEILPMPPGRRN